ncbi:MAG: AI-2E family transporter [Candidatus Koribacter versatilis]|uniref:AI-2E family transporter n=1 Tax=Candidatus Korobacter versatilis TaxID=658062 RepID=A0A932A6G8_9BACT|nr:AI-2E family transporter [Candidatus Koribacter versatilis]
MQLHPHVKTAGSAIKDWFLATLQDALAVGAIWLVGLLIIGVPWAPFWAFLGAAFQFIPGVGAVLSLIGPAIFLFFKDPEDLMPLVYLLILYAVIAVGDGVVLQPYFMKRTAKVPLWASILVPLVCAFVLPFWGLLLAPPLLAIIYGFRAKNRAAVARMNPPQTAIGGPEDKPRLL